MQYAIYLPTYEPFGSARVIADLARDAEQAGWDGIFLWDDVAGYEKDLADPWISLAAAAMVTQRVRLGALITPLARRRPWKFARETATLDQLSGGRLVIGVGVGGGQDQFGDLGDEADQRVRGEMLDEGLEVVTGLWSGESFQHDGKYYHLKPTVFCPRPAQQPRIPIWVAGVWPHKRPLQRMAHWDGMFPLFWGMEDLAEQQTHLREMVAQVQEMRHRVVPDAAGRPFDVIAVGVTAADPPAKAEEQVAGFAAVGATWWLEALEPERGGKKAWSLPQLRERVLAGPPGRR